MDGVGRAGEAATDPTFSEGDMARRKRGGKKRGKATMIDSPYRADMAGGHGKMRGRKRGKKRH